MSVILHENAAFQLLAEGSADAFDFYYHKYHQSIFANIFKIVKDRESAKDIVQEVFLAFWKRKDTFASIETIGGWLFVVSYNKAVSFLKQRLKESTILLENPAIIEQLRETVEIDEQFYQRQLLILEDAIKHLPKRKREVFSLCRFEGKSVEYAAAALGISVNSVKDYLKQSTRMVRQYIRDNHSSELAVMTMLLLILNR